MPKISFIGYGIAAVAQFLTAAIWPWLFFNEK